MIHAPPMLARAFFTLLALGATLASSCKDPGRIDLLLRPAENLDLAAVPELEVRLLVADTAEELDRASVPGADLESLGTAFAKSAIDPGTRYVFEVRAPVDADVCAAGRVVGRSLPVAVDSDTARTTATMYVACADAVAPTGRMHAARAGHGVIWAEEQGGALFVGGASELENLGGLTPLDSIERYDPATGRFEETPALHEARFAPGVAQDAEGRVVVLGGATRNLVPTNWLDTVEEIDGELRRGKGVLDTSMADPAVLPLSGGWLALLGVGFSAPASLAQVIFYDTVTEAAPRDPISPNRYNIVAVPFPGRDRALLVGAAAGDGRADRPALFCGPDDCCGDDPCLVPLGSEAEDTTWGPGADWQGMAGAWLDCPAGGGTAYVMGGHLGENGPALDDVWCYQDLDEPSGGLERVGALRHARFMHSAIAIRGDRVVVAGGTAGTEASISQAEILGVDPCACSPLDDGDIVDVVIDADLDRIGRAVIGRSANVLGDGSVLLAGAVSVVNLAGDLRADDEAWVLMPDLGP